MPMLRAQNGASLVLTVVATVVTISASLLHGTEKELRHGATELELFLRRAKVASQNVPGAPGFHDLDKYREWRYSPRMFVAEGCDASTAIMTHAFRILKLHNLFTPDPESQKELLDPSRNPYITSSNTDIVAAMAALKEDYTKQEKTLVFKSILHRDASPTLDPKLKNLGTFAVYNTRRNTLDHLACMIRDCFLVNNQTTPYGQPVDAEGRPTNSCFDRRSSDSSNNLAQIKIEGLADNLQFFEEQVAQGIKWLREAGYDAAHTTMEDIIGFEESEDQLPTSFKAWKALLTSWGIVPIEDDLRTYLRSQAGTWKPESQRSSIFNVDAVHAELKRIGRQDLIRLP